MPKTIRFDRKMCVAVDLQSYGSRDDHEQAELQHTLRRLLDEAADAAMLDRTNWTTQGKGDEELALVPLGENEPRVVDDFVRHLCAALYRVNRNRSGTAQLRLRVAIHHGVAYPADNGFAGQGVVAVSRLLNSAPIRDALRESGADLAVVLSRAVVEDLVLQGHTSIRAEDLVKVRVTEKEFHDDAWTYVPSAGAGRQQPTVAQHAEADNRGSVQQAGRDLTVNQNSGNRHSPKVYNDVGTVSGHQVVFGVVENRHDRHS